ncbi:bulb-type lectin domain protein (plasmid) [Zymomonas mobilis subsp. mobilis ZM4 = ATCC 31821]|uniref:hypothetical protein n=1 Tax=Zymomonas mobilis TaxID=542 RepID=UPI00078625EF|nr:hypothetical protein [Zymomonas mobilis]AVZ26865.1 bulb-type lectin domain protein [Zymomonas mobilis subsp. mobilis]AVZ43197.1 bulb-type lectin domain protein [Zymomonas mobilis subsp. mobilis ZM4 = ATCC 31821]UBQ08675.1 phage tail protein [Zymomonas mobilis]
MALKITITDAGRAALINADHSGTRLVSISSVGVSATAITADKSATSLADEIKRLTTISGKITASDAIHLIAKDDGSDVYTIKSFALYLDDGTLFAIYGQSSPILEKSAAAMLLLQLDIRFADIDATQIQFGNLDFINPAATDQTVGVARLTALGEAEQSTENIAVSPAELRRYAEKLARQADMIAALATKFDKTGGTVNGFVNADAFNSGAFYANKEKADFSYGGQHLALQADGNCVYYDGTAPYASISPTLANFPANTLVTGNTVWHRGNDGAGSGLDADLLDGLDSSAFLRTGGSTFTGDSYVNGWAFYCSTGGSKARINFETIDHISLWNNAGNVAAYFDLSSDNKDLYVGGNIRASALNTATFSANGTQVDFLYANRRTSFQPDGNNVWYGTDGVARSIIKDGNFWTHGSVSTDNVVNATGMFHVQSWNGLNALDMHSDDDGIVRMYAKNGNVDYQGFLAFNPQGNIDFYSPTGQCFINGQLIWNKNNDGAGSGLDADFLDGIDSTGFVKVTGSAMQGDLFMNGWAIYNQGGYGSGSTRVQFEKNNHLTLFNGNGEIAVWFDLDGSNKALNCNDAINTQKLYSPTFATDQSSVTISYGKRHVAFQPDGNNVWYGTDNAVLTSILDGNFWTRGSLSAANNINATGMLHVQSFNGQNGLDMHSDDDGIVRMYGKNANVNWQGFLAFNPQGNIDFYSPTGQCFINGQLIWNKNNDGAGSGLDADLLDGLDSSYFAPNSRIQTWGVPNGLMKRVDDHVELHLRLDKINGTITLPHTFNNIVDIRVQPFAHDGGDATFAAPVSNTNNTVTIDAWARWKGETHDVDVGGFIYVYGN